ncbi:hypothetical protein MB897_004304 [Salmonella enterica]|nr:hypothetical protein [Salmonella enterica]EIL8818235.1 hypothetical protein [Salmonella enterica]EIW3007516.1 hypothetical protein [Salmonella enterica]EJD3341011.1 hypothetical protein [Salmonella enterica]EJU4377390.1 hypothetical protein [Salmonella enterica]
MMKNQTISREDVLRDFSVEFDAGKDTLLRYLTKFPEYAEELVDLSRELAREVDDDMPLTETDVLSVESAMERFRTGLTQQIVQVNIPPQRFSAAAKLLNLPKQVLIAFGGRRVDLASIPSHFLSSLAASLQVTTVQLRNFLTQPPQAPVSRSYKSEVKPTAPTRTSFEKILRDAQVSEERIQEIIKGDE